MSGHPETGGVVVSAPVGRGESSSRLMGGGTRLVAPSMRAAAPGAIARSVGRHREIGAAGSAAQQAPPGVESGRGGFVRRRKSRPDEADAVANLLTAASAEV